MAPCNGRGIAKNRTLTRHSIALVLKTMLRYPSATGTYRMSPTSSPSGGALSLDMMNTTDTVNSRRSGLIPSCHTYPYKKVNNTRYGRKQTRNNRGGGIRVVAGVGERGCGIRDVGRRTWDGGRGTRDTGWRVEGRGWGTGDAR